MKKNRILCLLLAAVMLLSLCACGGKNKESDDPNHFELGDYVLDYKGACIMYDEVGRDSLVMTFDFTNNSKENASCGWVITTKYMQGGVEMESAYVIEDINTYSSIAEKYYSDIAPGVTLEVRNARRLNDMSEVTVEISELWSRKSYTLTVDPSSLERIENEYSSTDWSDWDYDSEEEPVEEEPVEEEPIEEEPVASFTDWWEGDWYGWWIVDEGTGDYEGYTGYWWDAFARISVNDDLTGTVEIWDEEGSYDDLIGELEVSFTAEGGTEHGMMVSESGQFMGAVREPGEWVIDPADASHDEMIVLEGINVGDNGQYSFSVYLRPWGTRWEDVDAADRPYYYSDWYLRFVEAGAAMPDKFDENAVPEAGSGETASTAAFSGNMVPFTVDGKSNSDVPFTVTFSLPEGLWDMETKKSAYNFKIYNCPDGDDVPWDTPFIWVMYYDNEEKLNADVPNFENLSETEGRTIGGVEMQGRKYDRFGYEQMQEYYGVLPNGLGVSIRLVKAPDSLLPECYAILDSISFG